MIKKYRTAIFCFIMISLLCCFAVHSRQEEYVNQEYGFTVTIPGRWKDRVEIQCFPQVMLLSDGRFSEVVSCHLSFKENERREFLCSIGIRPFYDAHQLDLAPMIETGFERLLLKKTDTFLYTFFYPADRPNNSSAEYRKLHGKLDVVRNSISWIPPIKELSIFDAMRYTAESGLSLTLPVLTDGSRFYAEDDGEVTVAVLYENASGRSRPVVRFVRDLETDDVLYEVGAHRSEELIGGTAPLQAWANAIIAAQNLP